VWTLGSDVTVYATVMACGDKPLSGLSLIWRDIF
jgi:hypothetical protein